MVLPRSGVLGYLLHRPESDELTAPSDELSASAAERLGGANRLGARQNGPAMPMESVGVHDLDMFAEPDRAAAVGALVLGEPRASP
jgi:hypothetical protein